MSMSERAVIQHNDKDKVEAAKFSKLIGMTSIIAVYNYEFELMDWLKENGKLELVRSLFKHNDLAAIVDMMNEFHRFVENNNDPEYRQEMGKMYKQVAKIPDPEVVDSAKHLLGMVGTIVLGVLACIVVSAIFKSAGPGTIVGIIITIAAIASNKKKCIYQ